MWSSTTEQGCDGHTFSDEHEHSPLVDFVGGSVAVLFIFAVELLRQWLHSVTVPVSLVDISRMDDLVLQQQIED